MDSPVFLEGETVTLHPVEEADAEFLQRLVNDPQVRPGIGATDPVTLAEEREYVDVYRYGLLADEWARD